MELARRSLVVTTDEDIKIRHCKEAPSRSPRFAGLAAIVREPQPERDKLKPLAPPPRMDLFSQ